MAIKDFAERLLENFNITYSAKAVYIYSIEAAMFALLYLTISLIFVLLDIHLNKTLTKKRRNSEESEYLFGNERSNQKIVFASENQECPNENDYDFGENKVQRSLLQKLFYVASVIAMISSILSLAVIPSILSSVEVISVPLSIFLTLLFFVIIYFFVFKAMTPKGKKTLKQNGISIPSSSKSNYLKEVYSTIRFYPKVSILLGIFSLLYSFSVPMMTVKTCLAYYEPILGASYDAFDISTAFYRWLTLPEACPQGKICHIYSTLPEDASTSIILNIHTGIDINSLQAIYEASSKYKKTNNLSLSKEGISLKFDVDSKGSRYIHSIILDNLTPNTDYYVQFLYHGEKLGDANFCTLPSEDMESNIVMIIGGDSGSSEIAISFINELAKHNPDVIQVGGDIAYDNGNFNCYHCWDFYLNQFEQLNKRRGKLIPLILAIGNHDIGQDASQFIGVDPSQNYFFLFFPQHSKPNTNPPQVPLPEERKSYFYQRIGNTLQISLDSNYIVKHDGDQLNWLQNIIQKFPSYAKFATYHVPMFPACFFNPNETGYDERKDSWVLVFEEHRFMTIFENHYHLFKRTFPLKFTPYSGPGVVYLGDGAWGANPEECYEEDSNRNISGIFETMGNMNHVWIVTLTKEKVEYKAINIEGDIFDHFSQTISDYKVSYK